MSKYLNIVFNMSCLTIIKYLDQMHTTYGFLLSLMSYEVAIWLGASWMIINDEGTNKYVEDSDDVTSSTKPPCMSEHFAASLYN